MLPSLYDILKISVKISKEIDGVETLLGTGTIMTDVVDYYVLTAAHCFRDEDGNDNCELKDIVVTYYDNEKHPTRQKPYDWKKSTVELDAAWLKIKDPHNGFDFKNGLKLLGEEIDEPACVYGYTEDKQEGFKQIYALKSPNVWRCKEGVKANGGEFFDTIRGTSGGGLLVKVEDVIYCMGYVKRTYADNQVLEDVVVHPMSNFGISWGNQFVNRIEDVTGRKVRTRECNEKKAHYGELWNELYDGIYKNKDVSSTLIQIRNAKKEYPVPKNVRQQEQVISLLLRRQEAWPECYQDAFLMALQDKGQWWGLYFNEEPERMGKMAEMPLANKQIERGVSLLCAPNYEDAVEVRKGDEATYENIMRKAFSLDFAAMKAMLREWQPQGFWIVRRALLLNLFENDKDSLEQVKTYFKEHEFESLDEKFLTATTINLINADFTNRIDYQEFWDKGIDGISDLLTYISGNIDKQKNEVGIYGIHNSILFGGEDTQSYPEALRVVQTLIETGMVPCMNFISVISKENWLKVAQHLFRDMPYPVVFYTLMYTDEKIVRRVAQEMCFTDNEKVMNALPDIMLKLLDGFKECPHYSWKGILYMTREWYVAVPEEVWYGSFVKNILYWFCYEINPENVSYRDELFLNIQEAIAHIKDRGRKREVLFMLFDTIDKNPHLINRLVDTLAVDDELLAMEDVEVRLKSLLVTHPLKETYRIIHRFFTQCNISEDLRAVVHDLVQKDSFDFGNDAGIAYGMLSFVLTEPEDIRKLKVKTLQMNMWDCGIMEKSYTDPRYTHLESFNRNMHWTEEEWGAIKDNMLVNIELMGRERPHRDGFLKHFSKQYIDLLSNMRYFMKKIQAVEGYDVCEVAGKADALIQQLRGYNNVVEMLSSDDHDTVVEGIWFLRDCFVDEGLENCRVELMLLINRVLVQKPIALEQCMSLLAALVEYKPEEMTEEFGGLLFEVVKKYCDDFDYKALFVSVPDMYKWLRRIAKGIAPKYGEEAAVKYWLEDKAVNRFDYVD
ncbi:MAG: trypsin-like serine protease [Bacteroidales bacterium]|nr:trypsin-like serine protease [Bacteroidales bacterium]